MLTLFKVQLIVACQGTLERLNLLSYYLVTWLHFGFTVAQSTFLSKCQRNRSSGQDDIKCKTGTEVRSVFHSITVHPLHWYTDCFNRRKTDTIERICYIPLPYYTGSSSGGNSSSSSRTDPVEWV